MRYTLLEMVQRILGAMDSDEVNTIADTTESLEVARIIKECYNEIASEIVLKDKENLFHLDASTDASKPTVMYLPANVDNISKLRYNIGQDLNDSNFRTLEYLYPEDFLDYMNGLDPDATWVDSQTVSLSGQDFQFKFRNDQSPFYWTSTDDRTIVMDAFDLAYENTLTSSRTYAYGTISPVFRFEDTYIPEISPQQFALLMAAAKAQAFGELKQTENTAAQKKERRHRILAYKTNDRVDNRTALQKHRGYGR